MASVTGVRFRIAPPAGCCAEAAAADSARIGNTRTDAFSSLSFDMYSSPRLLARWRVVGAERQLVVRKASLHASGGRLRVNHVQADFAAGWRRRFHFHSLRDDIKDTGLIGRIGVACPVPSPLRR